MSTLTTDIYNSIESGDDDTSLNSVIHDYLTTRGFSETVAEWRISNYEQLRTWAYPKIETYTTAKTKIESGAFYFDADMRAEGQSELDQYYADYIGVTERFPAVNPYDGGTNYTALSLLVMPVQGDAGSAISFEQGYGVDTVAVDGKYVDKRDYDISISSPSFYLYTPGYYSIKFTGTGKKEKKFVAVKQGPTNLYVLAGLKARPMDCHRNLIARATI